MALNKKFFPKVSAAADTFTPSEHFNTVLYTGNGSSQRIGGYINRGAVFNGSNSYIYRSASGFPTGNNSRSISLWVDNKNTTIAGIIGYGNTSTAQAFYLYLNAQGKLGVYGYFYNYDSNYTLPTNQWVHLVITHDGTTTRVYANGTEQFNLARTFNTGTDYFRIGGVHWNNSSEFFNGKIDQVRIFDKALSSSEITTLYNETHSSTTISTTDIFSDNSAIALYQLDGNANDTGGASGKYGAAGIFNGSSSYISTPNPLGTGNVAYSISAWINLNSSSHTGGIYTIWDSGTTAGTYLFFKVESGSISIGNYGSTVTSSNTLSTNQWVHVVVTRDTSNNVVLYVNGASDTTGTLSLNLGNHSAKIGALASSTQNFNGRIDDVRIYSDVLTSTEVGYIYNNTTASIPTDNLEAYYKLNGDARDETVPSYDGTASNVTYAYDGTATNVTYQEATKFSPDLVWIKGRSFTIDHALFDSVRGAQKYISPSTTGSEGTYSTVLTSFDSNGFTVGSNAGVNQNSQTHVAWCFNAGSGSSASNTDGSITSTVKANQDAGFSIVQFTTSGGSGTVGHGLNDTPKVVLMKRTSTTSDWYFFTTAIDGSMDLLKLNTTNSQIADSIQAFTSTTFKDWASSGTWIAYCFHDVTGYQKIGSYDGTGAAGNMVETGFEPAFILVKNTSNSTDTHWGIFDNKRDNTNPNTGRLLANLSNAESTTDANWSFDFYSNGFVVNSTSNQTNASGSTYIYLAIAADPDTTTPTVENSFDVVTYTGNASNNSVEVDFNGGLTWIKNRTDSNSYHILFDEVRGLNQVIHSNLTNAQQGSSNNFEYNNGTLSFDGSTTWGNKSGSDYVAWCWKAGDHDDNLPEINTEGTIDSTVSVNDAAGFSIVKWVGDGNASSTVGHGLSSPPEVIISKDLNNSSEWQVYHSGAGSSYKFGGHLNLDAGFNTSAGSNGGWNTPTSTTLTFSNGSSSINNLNKSGSNIIAYCWYSITEHSSMGNYQGTGATGNAQTLGFRPRFIIIKSFSNAEPWFLLDSQRDTENPVNNRLMADSSAAEDGGGVHTVDFTDTGFTANGTVGNGTNGNGVNYIYMAFK